MVARGPGAVGCAHCTRLGAEVACEVCGHLVCQACAAQWSTCALPFGRVFRLGRTGRMFDVDAAGRLALTSRWTQTLRVVDLRALAWVPSALPMFTTPEVRPRLTAGGTVAMPEDERVGEYTYFMGIALRPLDGGNYVRMVKTGNAPLRGTGVSARGDVYWYVTDAEQVCAVSLAETPDELPATYEPLPRKVIQAVQIDTARGLLAAATWGEITLHQIVDRKLALLTYLPTTGDVDWVSLGGDHFAVRVKAGADRGITVRRLDAAGHAGDVVLRIPGDGWAGALSRDGRYLAAAVEHDDIVVHDLERGTQVRFEEHTDRVRFVKFAGDDHLLVTADDDNRVILRPRGPDGYARALMPATLAR